MITQIQIKELAADFAIDEFTVFREYLQLIFLSYFYQNKKTEKIYFKGGTAIHFFLDSPRFSEDLDFSSEYRREEIKEIIQEVQKELKRELQEAEISLLHQCKDSIRFRLKYKSVNFKYPFTIRIDFTEKEAPKEIVTLPLLTKFPIVFFPIIPHLSAEEILAEKIRALLTRTKGRDLFDLWFLLKKGVVVDFSLAEKKLKEVKKGFDREYLLKKIKNYSLKHLEADLNKFLPQQQRKIVAMLKDFLLEELNSRELS